MKGIKGEDYLILIPCVSMNWALGLVRGWGDRVGKKFAKVIKGYSAQNAGRPEMARGENRDEFPKNMVSSTTDHEKTEWRE
jgi:hypothetical protein